MTDPAPPVRMLARSIAKMLQASRVARGRPHGGDNVAGLIFDTLLSANLAHLPYGSPEARRMATPGGAEAKRELMRPISAHAVAQSLALPYETVRTRIRRMLDAGYCEQVDGGVIAIAGALLDAPFQRMAEETRDVAVQALRDLAILGFDFAGMATAFGYRIELAEQSAPAALAARIIIDLQIRYLEDVGIFGGVIRASVWSAVMCANVRRMSRIPELAWRYSTQACPPPDALRDPISVRALAAEVGLPFETTRRHVAALVEKGWLVVAAGGGLIAPAEVMSEDALGRGNNQLGLLYAKLIADLSRAGIDFAAL